MGQGGSPAAKWLDGRSEATGAGPPSEASQGGARTGQVAVPPQRRAPRRHLPACLRGARQPGGQGGTPDPCSSSRAE
eukprot:6858016-Pyramimonas_sp.AAC.1